MAEARRAGRDDLEGLLDLFRAAEVSAAAEPAERACAIWEEILAREGMAVFVSEAAGPVIAATCTLITAPNLLRGGQAHGFLENIVTRTALRGQGHGRAVVGAALRRAWEVGCFHVLLQSGRADLGTHRFYISCGFEPGLRAAYVARRPGAGCVTG